MDLNLAGAQQHTRIHIGGRPRLPEQPVIQTGGGMTECNIPRKSLVPDRTLDVELVVLVTLTRVMSATAL